MPWLIVFTIFLQQKTGSKICPHDGHCSKITREIREYFPKQLLPLYSTPTFNILLLDSNPRKFNVQAYIHHKDINIVIAHSFAREICCYICEIMSDLFTVQVSATHDGQIISTANAPSQYINS